MSVCEFSLVFDGMFVEIIWCTCACSLVQTSPFYMQNKPSECKLSHAWTQWCAWHTWHIRMYTRTQTYVTLYAYIHTHIHTPNAVPHTHWRRGWWVRLPCGKPLRQEHLRGGRPGQRLSREATRRHSQRQLAHPQQDARNRPQPGSVYTRFVRLCVGVFLCVCLCKLLGLGQSTLDVFVCMCVGMFLCMCSVQVSWPGSVQTWCVCVCICMFVCASVRDSWIVCVCVCVCVLDHMQWVLDRTTRCTAFAALLYEGGQIFMVSMYLFK